MNDKKYLDYEGLQTLVSIIKSTYAEQSDLSAVSEVATNAASVAANNTNSINNLTTVVNGKASQADLNTLSTTVSGKADQSDLNALSTTVSGKASQSDLNSLSNNLSTNYYTSSQVDTLIGQIQSLSFEVVQSVSDVTEEGVIYLVPADDPGSEDYYDEYMLIDNSPEKIGSTRIDLSDYVTQEEINLTSSGDIDSIFHEYNIDLRTFEPYGIGYVTYDQDICLEFDNLNSAAYAQSETYSYTIIDANGIMLVGTNTPTSEAEADFATTSSEDTYEFEYNSEGTLYVRPTGNNAPVN